MQQKAGEGSLKSHWWFILLMGLIYTVNFVDRTIVSVLGEAIRRDLGLSDLQLGMMGGLSFALLYTMMGIPIARVAERRSRIGIIALATGLWSVMTALCGGAGSFAQLLACRAGVGIGEAGLTPPLVSLLSDRFAADRRATAYSLITLGAPIGGAIAAVAGGYLAQAHGWRIAFVAVGAPGLVLALVVMLTLREPVRQQSRVQIPSFADVLRHLGTSPAFLLLTAGSALVSMVGYALSLFLVPLLVRRYGLELKVAGGVFALTYSLATAIGMVSGGLIADRLGRRSVRWFGWGSAIALCVALPLIIAAVLQDDWHRLMGLLFVASMCLYAFLPAIMTVTQRLVPPDMRASAAALHAFGQTVIGLGLGSVVVGASSDALTRHAFGPGYDELCANVKLLTGRCAEASATGLQQAILAISAVLVLAIFCYWRAATALPREIQASQTM
jgi:MFS family permease